MWVPKEYLPEPKIVAAAATVVLVALVTVALNAMGVVGITFDQVQGLVVGGLAAVAGGYMKKGK